VSRKVVFLDIDGTLTNFNGELPDSAAEALAKARANGHRMVICTGRAHNQIYSFLMDSGLFDGVVCSTGCDVRVDGKAVYQHTMTREMRYKLIDLCERTEATYILQGANGCYAKREIMEREGALFPGDPVDKEKRKELFGEIQTSDDIYSHEDIEKACYYSAKASIEEIREALGEEFTVAESSYKLQDGSSDGEVTVTGYDKGFGMEKFLEAVGALREDSVAFGDGPNDYEMLDFAAVSVAMGNAADELKAHADYVTERVDRDGLALGFKRLGLI